MLIRLQLISGLHVGSGFPRSLVISWRGLDQVSSFSGKHKILTQAVFTKHKKCASEHIQQTRARQTDDGQTRQPQNSWGSFHPLIHPVNKEKCVASNLGNVCLCMYLDSYHAAQRNGNETKRRDAWFEASRQAGSQSLTLLAIRPSSIALSLSLSLSEAFVRPFLETQVSFCF